MDGSFDDEPETGTSIAAPLIRALLAAAIAFGLYWLVFAQTDPADDVAVLATPTATVQAAPTVPVQPVVPTTPPPTMESTPVPTMTPAPDQVGAGVTVQLLNGTDDQEAFDEAAEALEELGYEVTRGPRARNDYAQTTVFASEGQEAEAQALVAADPRFTTVEENPGNLDPAIDVHVVVGEDWDSGAGAGTATGAPTDAVTESATTATQG